jgi:hypothetical protein
MEGVKAAVKPKACRAKEGKGSLMRRADAHDGTGGKITTLVAVQARPSRVELSLKDWEARPGAN